MAKTRVIWKSALVIGLVYFTGGWRLAFSAEKLKYGTSVKFNSTFALPVLAAEEKGFWRAEGLEVEWIPFQGGAQFNAAFVAGHVKIGAFTTEGALQAGSRGIPGVIVYALPGSGAYRISVRADSPVKEPQDLKGTKLGIIRYGAVSHAYARAVLKALKLEGQVKMLALGGIPAGHAALRSGAIDAWLETELTASMEGVKGLSRRLLTIDDYLGQDQTSYVVMAHKDFIKRSPTTVRKVLNAISRAVAFISTNPEWTVAKLKAELGLTEEGARQEYRILSATRYGKVDRRVLENVTNFLIEYGQVPKENMPRLDDIYTNEFADKGS